jgi:alkylation response protein AidB-like acyl-CoA dehydrogenase
MPQDHRPDAGAIGHVLTDVLHAPSVLCALPPHAAYDADLQRQVLEGAAEFVGGIVAPLTRVGDEVGAAFQAGQVTMPPGFRAAYQSFWQAGWPALAHAQEDGGQGLPLVLEMALYEMLSAANHGWTMAPGLLTGAYETLKHHGDARVHALFLPHLATGEWLATMCLTEPHAGSDLGLIRTKATPQPGPDGATHRLDGGKIFISGGEHDLTDNIIHLVLARLPDAPPGPKGLSLFVVPKFLPDGSRNGAYCDRIEEKMGLHGSPTCVMRFEHATGWLVGEAGKGLGAMFIMMNTARLHVALQGIGLLEAAHQRASAYSLERRQMRAPGAKDTSLIAEHPAVRRILDTQRAWIDCGRVLAYHTALELEVARAHQDADRRDAATRWCALATPIMKSAFTEQGFAGASACLQVFGGHGYVREWGIEQVVRDARVAMIYEGTNEIQALDLLQRKVMPDGGAAFAAALDALEALPAEKKRFAILQQLGRRIAEAAATRIDLPAWVADDFLRACAVALLAWAGSRLAAAPGNDASRWERPLQALHAWVLPEFEMRVAIIDHRLSSPT